MRSKARGFQDSIRRWCRRFCHFSIWTAVYIMIIFSSTFIQSAWVVEYRHSTFEWNAGSGITLSLNTTSESNRTRFFAAIGISDIRKCLVKNQCSQWLKKPITNFRTNIIQIWPSPVHFSLLLSVTNWHVVFFFSRATANCCISHVPNMLKLLSMPTEIGRLFIMMNIKIK